jgi:hypothetical protein
MKDDFRDKSEVRLKMVGHTVRRLIKEKARLAKLKNEPKIELRRNKRQEITPGQAMEYAKRILKGETLKDIAAAEGRCYQRLGYWMSRHGYGVQSIKRKFTSDGFRR